MLQFREAMPTLTYGIVEVHISNAASISIMPLYNHFSAPEVDYMIVGLAEENDISVFYIGLILRKPFYPVWFTRSWL